MTQDEKYMRRCLDLASQSLGKVYPNPMVGAVIVHNDKVIGEGFHEKYGEAHAEVNAVNSVKDLSLLKESTIFVSLEPCAHYGKTPPCADLLVKHNFKRVVIGTIDPFSKVAGNGVRKLIEAGIEVTLPVLEQQAQELNKRFFTFVNKQRPYIILKWAQTNDGFMDRCRDSENTQGINWITQPDTKKIVHQWRAEEAAILVGKNTVLNDNPQLTVREANGNHPLRLVLDANLEIPSHYAVFDQKAPTLILNTKGINKKVGETEWIDLNEISPASICQLLYERNIQSLIVEGGANTLEQFITANLWDEARVLEGEVSFIKGLRAPKLSIEKHIEYPIGKDKCSLYMNLLSKA